LTPRSRAYLSGSCMDCDDEARRTKDATNIYITSLKIKEPWDFEGNFSAQIVLNRSLAYQYAHVFYGILETLFVSYMEVISLRDDAAQALRSFELIMDVGAITLSISVNSTGAIWSLSTYTDPKPKFTQTVIRNADESVVSFNLETLRSEPAKARERRDNAWVDCDVGHCHDIVDGIIRYHVKHTREWFCNIGVLHGFRRGVPHDELTAYKTAWFSMFNDGSEIRDSTMYTAADEWHYTFKTELRIQPAVESSRRHDKSPSESSATTS
jgi:hypothetical protein